MKKLMTMIAGALSAFALFASNTGVTVNGTDVGAGSGEGWTYDPETHYVEVTGGGAYVLSGTNTEGKVMFAIDADAEVTLSNLCLKCTTKDECCLWATNDVNVTLFLAGTNTLDAYTGDFAVIMGEGLCIENGSHLVVTNAPGFADADAVLIAKGSYNYAAIAVGRNGAEGEKPYFEIAGGTVYANWFDSPAKWSTGIGASYRTGRNGEADIVISGGRVFARGGWGDPGIGAADYDKEAAPDIWITGGYVEAVGGSWASAIGGGLEGKYGSVTVSGGTVRATGGDSASDMIAGYGNQGGGDFTVTGGSIWLANDRATPAPKNAHGQAVYRVLVQSIDSTGAPVTIEGLEDYGTDDIYTHDGQIWLWLPNGVHTFAVNGTYYRAEVNDGPTWSNRHLGHDTGVTINGREVAWLAGSGWRYHPDEKYVEMWGKDGSYVLSGTNTAGEVMFAIDENAEVTLSNLCLRCTTAGECCIWATNDVNVTLYLAGTNTLDASANGEGICIENDTRLTITNAQGFADEDAVLIAKGGPNCAAIATGRNNRQEGKNPYFEIAGGTVIATGGSNSAGIGGSNQAGKNSAAVMVISGGRVFATGAYHAAGIGSSDKAYWGGPDITITGGYVEAQGGEGAAGIGGGYDSIIGACVVRGGTVRASAGSDTQDDRPGCDDKAADMLGGHFRSSARFVISGGSVCLVHQKVRPQPKDGNDAGLWCVTVPGVATDKPAIEGLPAGYGTKDIVAVDGKIYLWLPDGEYKLIVGGKTYKAKVAGANTEAVEQPATPLAPGQSSLPYNTEAEARAAVQSGLVSFAPAPAVEDVLKESTILTVEGYKEMFTPVVYQTKEDGKWRVMYELTASATNTLMQSIHDVVTKIDLADITTEGVASMSLDGGIPGFYYTLFASDAVTSVTEPSSRDKTNSDRLCNDEGVVFFWNVEKPSDAAGFFTVSVSPEQAFTSGEPSADVRGGGIIVLPPVIATGSDD